ncbi:MAG: ABC transporter ATP-binding protein [Chitinophagaceae bacterium]
MSAIIQVTNLSKGYILSHEGKETYTALRDVVAKKASELLTFKKEKKVITKEEFWALKDVTFNINQGDRVGIIGRNGAGKSTLLKILSRITEPSSGNIKIKGRVASLLEVGTGFHPELTGRENIFLNGAILGMSRAEIKKHFDAIVDFAEIEKFLDTPVKRYSSGMYVRLAFAVAAHLEPEILVVDEVLAVGDAQFQKKCLGKMEDVSKNEGRTVLFVSHNLTAINSLCNQGILLNKGQIQFQGNVEECITEYLENGVNLSLTYTPDPIKDDNDDVKVNSAGISLDTNNNSEDIFYIKDPLLFKINYNLKRSCKLNLSLVLWTAKGDCVFNVCTTANNYTPGNYYSDLHIPADFLNDEIYTIEIYFVEDTSKVIHRIQELVSFEMHEPERDANWYDKWIGIIRPKLEFEIKLND